MQTPVGCGEFPFLIMALIKFQNQNDVFHLSCLCQYMYTEFGECVSKPNADTVLQISAYLL